MKRSLIICIVALVATALPAAAAYAAPSATISGKASCLTYPATWSEAEKACTLSSDWIIGTDGRLTIAWGVTLAVAAGKAFVNHGTVTNMGTLRVDGSFDNYQTLAHGGADSSTVITGSFLNRSVADNGVQIGAGGQLDNRGQFDVQVASVNLGRIINRAGARLEIAAPLVNGYNASLENYGRLLLHGIHYGTQGTPTAVSNERGGIVFNAAGGVVRVPQLMGT